MRKVGAYIVILYKPSHYFSVNIVSHLFNYNNCFIVFMTKVDYILFSLLIKNSSTNCLVQDLKLS